MARKNLRIKTEVSFYGDTYTVQRRLFFIWIDISAVYYQLETAKKRLRWELSHQAKSEYIYDYS